MNTGMADAYDLAGRLAAVTSGAADPSVLDGYDRERRAAATAVLAFTDRMTRVASLRSAPARALRNLALPTLTRIPAVRAAITRQPEAEKALCNGDPGPRLAMWSTQDPVTAGPRQSAGLSPW
jgi:2-polyprenyl-6-methoxyphenol hydroxylase-like FAD-dependent oxidoreductase